MPVVSPASPCPNPSIERIHLRPCQGRKPSQSACLVPDRIAVSCFWQDSRSGCVWFLLLLIIKNKKCCWSHGVLSKRNWGTIMIPISWYGKHVNGSTIAAQLPFQSKSTVLENMSIQWKTCQGWTSRYIFVDMLTKCQLLVILVCYHPSGQAWPSIQGGGPRISLTSTFGKVIFILKSDLVNWVYCSFCSTHPGLYLLFSSCANASIKLCERTDEWKECQRQ